MKYGHLFIYFIYLFLKVVLLTNWLHHCISNAKQLFVFSCGKQNENMTHCLLKIAHCSNIFTSTIKTIMEKKTFIVLSCCHEMETVCFKGQIVLTLDYRSYQSVLIGYFFHLLSTLSWLSALPLIPPRCSLDASFIPHPVVYPPLPPPRLFSLICLLISSHSLFFYASSSFLLFFITACASFSYVFSSSIFFFFRRFLYPSPFSQCCVFSGRLMGRGSYVFDRRWDRMRLAFQNMVEKHLNAQMWRWEGVGKVFP